MYFTLYSLSSLIAWLTVLLVGLFVYFNNPKSPVNRVFLWLSITITIWVSGCFLETTFLDPNLNILFDIYLYTGAAFAPSAFLHSILVIINRTKQRGKWLWISYFYSILFLVINFFFRQYYIPEVTHKISFRYIATPGTLWYFYILFFAGATILGLYELYKARHEAIGSRKNQLTYLSISYTTVIIAAMFYLLLAFKVETPPIDNLLVFLYSLMMGYAIVRHQLLDIEVVIKRTLMYSLLTAILTGLFVSVIAIANYFAISFSRKNSMWVGVLAALLIALVLQPLRDAIQKLVDRLFFRSRYDYQNILKKYSGALARPMTDLTRFSKVTPYLLWKSLKLESASFMVLDRAKNNYVVRAGNGKTNDLIGVSIPVDSYIIRDLTAKKTEINLDDVLSTLKTGENLNDNERAHLESIKNDMVMLKVSLIIPCISESEYFNKPTLLSTLNLGKKLSDEPFSREDIGFLKTLANQAAISIEYAFILEELRRNQDTVLKTEKLASLGTITAGIAHELKNPLTYIITASQILATKWNDPEFRNSALTLLPAEAERMRIIVEGILGYSRSKELSLEPVEIAEVMKKVTALLSYEIKKKQAKVKEEFNHALKINGDQNRLIQVFINLVSNSIQAMGDNGGDITISTKDIGDDKVEIKIADTGRGIAKDKLNTIFEPFYTTKQSGTGLGLAIVKKYVEEHHGTIGVDSLPGKGTTFTITLPSYKIG